MQNRVAGLNEEPSQHGPDVGPIGLASGGSVPNDAAPVILRQEVDDAGFELRCDHDFSKDLVDRLGGGPVQGLIYDDDSSVGRLPVRCECLVPRRLQVVGNGYAARIRVLEDRTGRIVVAKLVDQEERGTDIVQVVIGEIGTVDFGKELIRRPVESSLLMGAPRKPELPRRTEKASESSSTARCACGLLA